MNQPPAESSPTEPFPQIQTEAESRPAISVSNRAPRKLGVRFLLLWTGCSAVYLAVARSVLEADVEVPRMILVVGRSAFVGGVWAGALCSIWSYTSQRLRLSPGEWLLVACAISLAVTFVGELIAQRGIPVVITSSGVALACSGLVLAMAAIARQPSEMWKVAFVVLVLTYLLHILALLLIVALIRAGEPPRWVREDLGSVLYYGRFGLAFLIVLIAAVWDRPPKRELGPLHMFGIAAWLLWTAIMIPRGVWVVFGP